MDRRSMATTPLEGSPEASVIGGRTRRRRRAAPSAAPRAARLEAPISGRYEGEMTTPAQGRELLDLRVDIDQRYDNSPVMDRVSGDLYQLNRLTVPGNPPQTWRVYRESWIVETPTTRWSDGVVEVTGNVRFWKNIHLDTAVTIRIPWATAEGVGPAHVVFARQGDMVGTFSCTKRSDTFRDLNLEIDVCQSVNQPPIVPTYSTDQHPNRPDHLPLRALTIEEAYREAGVRVTIRPERTVIDDTARAGHGWTDAELHDAMEAHFSQIGGPWPRWEMWGVLAGTYEQPAVGGIMFDYAAAFGGPGRAPERQGFAVFRDHQWFAELTAGSANTAAQAEAMRKFLYTWVHEAGHAFNLLHSWDKNRSNALSWMNYDWKYDQLNGADAFWSNFRFRFDDEELIHIRHGDRAAVIMGGDPWASGGHAEALPGAEYLQAPPGAMSQAEGALPIELLLRSQSYFEFMEPVVIEVRLRNLLDGLSLRLDPRLNPEYGNVTFYIRRPSGRIVQYAPIMCKAAPVQLKTLSPRQAETDGTDRHSDTVFLTYGKYGFYFDEPGDYMVRALYQGPGEVAIPSNPLTVRIGRPATQAEDRQASDFFTYEVGAVLYLYGSRSARLAKGWAVLEDIVRKSPDSMRGVRIRAALANSLAKPFIELEQSADGGKRAVERYPAHLKESLETIAPAVEMLLRRKDDRTTNLLLNHLVRRQAALKTELKLGAEAIHDLATLRSVLGERGVNSAVLTDIAAHERRLESGGT